MKHFSSVVILLVCVLSSTLLAARPRQPHFNKKRFENIRHHKRYADDLELNDFTFFTTIKRTPQILVLFYSSECRECGRVKKELRKYSNYDRPNKHNIGFVNTEENPLIAKDFRMPQVTNEFKIALFERGSKNPKFYPYEHKYDAESLYQWVKSSADEKHESHPRVDNPKPYEEINEMVFEKNKFHIKTWHKVLFFGAAGLGIAIVSYVIKKDLNTRRNFKTHMV